MTITPKVAMQLWEMPDSDIATELGRAVRNVAALAASDRRKELAAYRRRRDALLGELHRRHPEAGERVEALLEENRFFGPDGHIAALIEVILSSE